MQPRVRIALLLVAAVLPHLAVWGADFTFDDLEFVETNASIRSFGSALAAFDEPFPPHRPELARYRPLTNLSYAVQYAFWGNDPAGYHRANIALYVAIVFLVYRVGRSYLGALESKTSRNSRELATWFALLFALHPVHSEAVDSIAGHSELLSLLFSLTTLAAFHNAVGFGSRRTPSTASRIAWAATAHLCFVLATLAKESSVVLPGLLVAHLVLFHQRSAGGWRRYAAATQAASYFAILAAYFAARVSILGRFRPDTSILGDADLLTHVLTVGRLFSEYVRLLIFPYPLQVDYYYQHTIGVHAGWSASAVFGWLALVSLLAWTARELWRVAVERGDGREARAPALFGVLFFLATLFPVSHAVPIQALMAERFLFAPSLGFCLTAVCCAARFQASRTTTPRLPLLRRAVPATLLLCFAGLGSLRALEWRDSVTLWLPLAERFSDDHRVWANLGRGYLRRGDRDGAARALQHSLSLDPNHIAALNNLGTLELESGRFGRAREIYLRVLELDPESHVAWTNVGVIETRLLNHARSTEYYERALEVYPNHHSARKKLAVARQLVAEAQTFLAKNSELDLEAAPLDSLRFHALSRVVIGDRPSAEAIYRVLLRRSAENPRWRIPTLDYQLQSLAWAR